MDKYGYIFRTSKDHDDLLFTSNKKVPEYEVMIMMMQADAVSCEFYETNASDDIQCWKLLSTFGGIQADGIFEGLFSH